jgi:hypothetical protein
VIDEAEGDGDTRHAVAGPGAENESTGKLHHLGVPREGDRKGVKRLPRRFGGAGRLQADSSAKPSSPETGIAASPSFRHGT